MSILTEYLLSSIADDEMDKIIQQSLTGEISTSNIDLAGIDYVVCEECKAPMIQIQYRHLKCKHNMSIEEYRLKYPTSALIAEKYKNTKNSGKNPMDVMENREKIKQKLLGRNIGFGSPGKKSTHSDVTKSNMSKNNASLRDGVKKKISEMVKKSYVDNPGLKKVRSDYFKKMRNSIEFKNLMYDSGTWIPPHLKEKQQCYMENVRNLTDEEYQKYFGEILNAKLRSRNYHLDHKISIDYGFRNNIPEEVISHYKNLQVIPHALNESKGKENSLMLPELINEIRNSKHVLNEKILLLCGGAFGHLTHPYEDLSLTFSDVKDIVKQSLSGKIQADEKVDGQNLMFTWKNGQLRAARNKGHIKGFGANALTKNQLDQMFADRPPHIRQAFVSAMGDVEKALKQVDVRLLREIFQEGKRFMNVEVILPATQNVVPYGLNVLVFHGTVEYNEAGEPIGQGMIEAGQYLENIIKQVNANVQKNFTLRGPNRVALKQVKDFQQKKSEYLGKIKNAQGKLPDTATIADYHSKVWNDMIIKKASAFGYQVPKNIVADLVNRWVHDDKSKRIAQLQKEITNPAFKQWIAEFDGKTSQAYFKQVNEPFENLFLKLGVDVLANASGYLATSPDSTARQVAQQTQQEIEKIKQSNDPDALAKLERELERIQKLGGLEKMAGTEGITFYKNGKIYKLTGLFAPINQILGMIRFKR